MATTALEILDTAIKIGLGAVISGVATYLLSRSQKRHEMKKDYVATKMSLLKECALKLDESSSLRNRAQMHLQNLRLKGQDGSTDEVDKHLASIGRSYDLLKEARSIACLVGFREELALFDRYQRKVSESSEHFLIKRLAFDVAFVNANIQECTELSSQILEEISLAFEAIYA